MMYKAIKNKQAVYISLLKSDRKIPYIPTRNNTKLEQMPRIGHVLFKVNITDKLAQI